MKFGIPYHWVLVYILAGCSHAVSNGPVVSSPEITSPTSQTIFLTFKIMKDSVGKNAILLTDKIVTRAKIRETIQSISDDRKLTISILDSNNKVLQSLSIEHPLFKSIEYTDVQKHFVRKTVSLNEASFFVRLLLPAGATTVKVEEVIMNQSVNEALFRLL